MARTIGETVNALTARLAEATVESPRLDARVLVGHALSLDPSMLFARANDAFPSEKQSALEAMTARRIGGEPVSRIRGSREFWGLEFEITPATLDPRPDTETLVEAALRLRQPGQSARILDLGTGTGCILIAILAHWPEATGLGVDISPEAVEVAQRNAARRGVGNRATFQTGQWTEGLAERFDLIASNPPYIIDAEIPTLAREVAQFDPPQALRGGPDGLDAYRRLIPGLRHRLAPHGTVLLEVGQGQADAVAALLMAHELPRTAFYQDLGGVPRVVAASSQGADGQG